jgi:hypothetical protein
MKNIEIKLYVSKDGGMSFDMRFGEHKVITDICTSEKIPDIIDIEAITGEKRHMRGAKIDFMELINSFNFAIHNMSSKLNGKEQEEFIDRVRKQFRCQGVSNIPLH